MSDNQRQHDITVITGKLEEKYGHLLSTEEVAEVLRRKPGGIRFTMVSTRKRQQPWAQRLLRAKVRMGRRVFYHPWGAAEAMVLGDTPLERAETGR